jgi:hypothetical protein
LNDEERPLKIDNFEDCFVGTCCTWHGNQKVERLIYSGDKMVDKLTADEDGMDIHEALEYIEFNIEGAYVGPHTPIILWQCTLEDIEERYGD